jgi:putative hydrolase of the HAD superfamily
VISAVAAARNRVWIFDLDNTLHDARPHIFPHLNRSMTAYLAQSLSLSEADANELRVKYWHRYGATLVGVLRHHRQVDPHHFLRMTHEFPGLPALLVAAPQLRSVLRRLPGRKVLFSNAPSAYAREVLQSLGVARAFDAIYAIEQTRFRPKPDPSGFRRIVQDLGVSASSCIMVEDSLPNLRTAKRLGMTTVWIDSSRRAPAFVDVNVSSVACLPRALARRQLFAEEYIPIQV